MPNTPIQPGLPATTERRRQERVQPSGLVYLDIGTENGGIILNLNEGGAGVQAVAPLQVLSKVSIRFQLPASPKQVQAEAQVTWVSQSCRRIGLRFMDVPDEVRAQIRDWLRSQAASPERPTETGAVTPTQFETPPPNAPKEKQRDLLSKGRSTDKHPGTPETFPVRETRLNAPPETSFAGERDTVSAPLRRILPEIALAKDSDATETAAPYQDTDSASIGSGEQAAVDENVFEPSPHKGERAEVIHWPGIASIAGSVAKPAALTSVAIPAAEPPMPPSAAENSRISSAFAGPVTGHRVGSMWKIAIAVTVLLAASFEGGKWLGSIRAPIKPSDPTHIPIQQVEPTADNQRSLAAKERPEPSFRGRQTEHAKANVASQQLSSPTSNPPLTPSTIQPSVPPSPPVLSSPPGPSVDTPSVTQPRPPAADTGASAQVPAQTTVDGRVLAATDRFNPAHLLYRFDPDYPSEAQQQNVEGTVRLRLSIDANGAVDRVQMLSGPPLLVSAAISAVKNWRFLPALLNGEPVKSEQDVDVEFHLPTNNQ